MRNSYKKNLEKAEKAGVNIFDLVIAQEVDAVFGADERSGQGRDNCEFERICNLVGEIYLKVDTCISLSDIANLIHKMIVEEGRDVGCIGRHEVIGRL